MMKVDPNAPAFPCDPLRFGKQLPTPHQGLPARLLIAAMLTSGRLAWMDEVSFHESDFVDNMLKLADMLIARHNATTEEPSDG